MNMVPARGIQVISISLLGRVVARILWCAIVGFEIAWLIAASSLLRTAVGVVVHLEAGSWFEVSVTSSPSIECEVQDQELGRRKKAESEAQPESSLLTGEENDVVGIWRSTTVGGGDELQFEIARYVSDCDGLD